VAAKKLTAASIASLRPRSERYEVSDTNGLRLVVYPTGRKTWIVRFRRPDGRPCKLTLGPFDLGAETSEAPVIGAPLTLASARTLACEAMRAKAHGRDPAAERQAAKASVSEKSETFTDTLPVYFAHIEKHNRSAKEMAATLRGFATVWRDKPLAEIDAQACHELVERCRHGMPGQKVMKPGPKDSRACLAYTLLGGLFSWALRTRRIERSPMHGLERPQAATARDRVLDDAEIRTFWKACESLSPWHCAVLRLLLLTGARLREISELRSEEIGVRRFELGPQRTKNKRPHTIYLSSLAQEVMRDLLCGEHQAPEGDADWVFSIMGRAPIGGWTEVKAKLDAEMRAQGWNGPAFRIHDLRRTAATGLARQGTPIHVTEKILNHASGTLTGVAAVYNRYDYQAECREALERWSETVRGIVA
jgi:integrase